MNFYKHHLGDYDGATAHLDWVEDMAYTRLLRVYYRRERPIPADFDAACRLVRATMLIQKRAVETILKEFFHLSDDGWHNKRADEEIAAYQAQSLANQRVAKERWSKDKSTNRTRIVHESSTGATESRIPNQNHKPEPEPEPEKANSKSFRKAQKNGHQGIDSLIALGVDPQAANDWLLVRKAKRAPLTQTVLEDLQREAGKAGISVAEAVLICSRKSWQGFNASWDWKSGQPEKSLAELMDEREAKRAAH